MAHVKSARALILVAAAAASTVWVGCGDPTGTQYLPIGSRCMQASDCGTSPFTCDTAGFPGGYCSRTCVTDGDCPADALCAGDKECRRHCTADADCRQAEGYACGFPSGTTSGVCLPGPSTPRDLGSVD